MDLKLADYDALTAAVTAKQAAADASTKAEIEALKADQESATKIIGDVSKLVVGDLLGSALIAAACDVVPSHDYVASLVSVGMGGLSLDLAKHISVDLPKAPYRALFFLLPGPKPPEPAPAETVTITPADVGTVPASITATPAAAAPGKSADTHGKP